MTDVQTDICNYRVAFALKDAYTMITYIPGKLRSVADGGVSGLGLT